jgi:hypothetical protein
MDASKTIPGQQPPEPGTYTKWMIGTVMLIAAACGIFLLINYREDVLGLHGRKNVQLYALERYSKYLVSYRYVPDSFDGILLSNSIAANWDTGEFHSHRVFNAGLRGGTTTEERAIVENAVDRGRMKMAIIVLHPSLNGSHGLLTAYITPHDYVSSYGSVQTVIIYTQKFLESIGPTLHLPDAVAKHKFEPDGAMVLPLARDPSPEIPPFIKVELEGDPVAVKELKDVLADLHAHGVKVYGVFAPLYAPYWQTQGDQLHGWEARMTALFSPQDSMIDLNDGQLAAVQLNRDNYPDYVHLSPSAASVVVTNLVARIEHADSHSNTR